MKDIVDIIKEEGRFGVVEGADAVRQKIDELYAKDVIRSFLPKGTKLEDCEHMVVKL